MANFLNTLYRMAAGWDYYIIQGLIFVSVVLCILGIGLLVLRRRRGMERLRKFLSPEQAEEPKKSKLVKEEVDGFVTRIYAPVHKVIPAGENSGKRGRTLLYAAGLRSNQAYRNFMFFKLLCGVLFPLILFSVAFFYRLSPKAIAMGAVLSLVGFYLPNIVVRFLAHCRRKDITRAFPDALDLMVVCAESGLGLDLTFKRVGEEMRPISKALSDEFLITNLEIRAGKPRDESLKRMAQRTAVAEVNTLMSLLSQANRFGTSIARTLRVHSDAMRVKRHQNAETQAAKLSVKLVFPLVGFIFPALFVVILGPAALKIMRHLIPAMGGAQ